MIPTFVFVHGSASSAHGWTATQREMAARGYRTLAIDLPGRGAGFTRAYHEQDLETFAAEPSVMSELTLDDFVGQVIDAVRRVRHHGPVILVAHSFGGLPVTGAANAIPELIDRIVYIAAQCPVDRAPGEYPALPEWSSAELFTATAPLLVGDPARQGFIRVNWRGADREQRAALRNAVAAELTEEEYLQVVVTSQPDEVFWLTGPEWDLRADKETWGRIPRTFVKLTEDRSMPLAVQNLYITEGDALTPDNPFDVRELDSGHAGFLRKPAGLAEILDALSVRAGAGSR
ncbi:alpha/beta hydrolase [Amycolatopsis regifaucium]|uniref:Alpha/beta hydrolase n=1 Tax=Amycolatopsis regifaucium TaxID=546365 RepID=A0A154MAL8_9PSEU|nr:alpha/beta fold hydrolase [Amycolatopsis regifaucium]KZB81330.1 esterase [Amycolatopsis regifaucium]OKA04596.1 alpha/beta hydrolase [Amycolatopsis regifaucium]SFH34328.1 Pimeloyl-ACP methyl ester carboxylesterase [Amycolatopsis regifaucium]